MNYKLVFLCMSILFTSCDRKPPKVKQNIQTNIVILLDLSDRILATDQIQKDIEICINLLDNFIQIQKDQLYFNSNDKFKIVVANQNEIVANSKLYSIQDSLSVDMGQIPIKEKKNIKNKMGDFRRHLENLYKEAKISDNPNAYKGANIMKYFNEHAENDFNTISKCNNYLFILTDGYQYVEGKNYKPLDKWDAVANLNGIKVNIFEVNPRESKDEKEFNRIVQYWTDWMQSMNAEYIKIYSTTASSEIKSKIKNILNIKKNHQKNENQLNDSLEEKKNDNRTELTSEKSKTVNPNWLNKIFTELDIKLQNTTILCEQTEYTNLKIKISGYKGQEVTNDQIQQFKAEINDVPNNCRKAN